MPFLPISIEHIIILIFTLYFFFEVLQELVVEPIYSKAIFWILVAFLINSAGNFFLFIYLKNSFNDANFQKQYTIIYTTITVFKNLLLSISIIIKDSPKNESDNLLFDVDLDSLNPYKNQH